MGRNNRNGLPPRPPVPNSTRGSDSYRPYGGRLDNFRPPSSQQPPPPPYPPPHPPPPPSNVGKMSHDRWQPQPPQGEFTFRMQKPANVQDSLLYDRYVPDEGKRERYRGRDRRDRERERLRDWDRAQRRLPKSGPTYGPKRGKTAHASERRLLQGQHEEIEIDFANEGNGGPTYLSLDGLSDSEEAAMDISDSDREAESDLTETRERPEDAVSGPAAKRTRLLTASEEMGSLSNIPKWSNPDPYTALPCPDDSRGKRVDVVQLIRKARVQGTLDSKTAVKEEADFISFDEDGSGMAQPNGEIPSELNSPKSEGVQRVTSDAPIRNFTNPSTHGPLLPTQDGKSAATAIDLETNLTTSLVPSTELGSRKRTIDDNIKPLPPLTPLPPAGPQLSTQHKKMPVWGGLAPGWRCNALEDPEKWMPHISKYYPWYKDHKDAPAPAMFAMEVQDLYDFIRPRDFEMEIRQDVLSQLSEFCTQHWRHSQLKSFGSFQTGLFLPTGDMDVVLMSGSGLPFGKNQCWKVKSKLEASNIAHPSTIIAISKAKVPITKFVHSPTGLNIDISFDKSDGVNAISTFMEWKRQYPIMEPLVLLVKHFLAMRGLNEPVNGGIGGFSVIGLVVSFLQREIGVQAQHANLDRLGELLLTFFRHYGEEFDFANVAIQLNPPRLVNKNHVSQFVYKNRDRISIIDPNNPANDISGGSSNTRTIIRAFSSAYRDVSARLNEVQSQIDECRLPDGPVTILACIYRGIYDTWDYQRNRLQEIHQHKQQKGTLENLGFASAFQWSQRNVSINGSGSRRHAPTRPPGLQGSFQNSQSQNHGNYRASKRHRR